MSSYRASFFSVGPCLPLILSSASMSDASAFSSFCGEIIMFRPSVVISRGVSICTFRRSSNALSSTSAALLPWRISFLVIHRWYTRRISVVKSTETEDTTHQKLPCRALPLLAEYSEGTGPNAIARNPWLRRYITPFACLQAAIRSSSRRCGDSVHNSRSMLTRSELRRALPKSHAGSANMFPHMHLAEFHHQALGHYSKILKSASRMTVAFASTPVQYLMPMTPWFTSISSPSMTVQPRSAAVVTR